MEIPILTAKQKQQLNNFIGGDPKTFVRLYSAKNDSCDADIFHQTCDNNGPTITLVYNVAGDVYGGYASVSWFGGSDQYFYDDKAFLFLLSNKACTEPLKFPIQNSKQALLQEKQNGPTFGSGPDLLVFKGKIDKNEDDTLSLNSTMKSADYKNLPNSLSTSVSSDFIVTDVVVYKVLDVSSGILEEPWSPEPIFTEKYFQELLEDVETYWPLKNMAVCETALEYINILLIGPIGAGKSSFYNTIDSVFCNRVTTTAAAGKRKKSVTMRLSMYTFWASDKCQKPLRFRLWDCRGVDSQFNIARDIDAIVDGHVPDDFNLAANMEINERTTANFTKHPKLCDKIHCVAFVLDANNTQGESPFMSSSDLEQISEVQSKLDDRGISQRILLNKVDDACNLTRGNTGVVYNSALIRDRCIQAAKCLGLPPLAVLPMKNIYQERNLSLAVKTLALYNLRNLLFAADDYLRKHHLSELRDDKYEVSSSTINRG